MFVCVHVGVLFSANKSLPRRHRLPPFDLLVVAVKALSFPKYRSTRPTVTMIKSSSVSISVFLALSPCPLRFSIFAAFPSPPCYFISSCDSLLLFPPTILLSSFLSLPSLPPSAPSLSPSERLRIPKGADAIKMLILSVYRERWGGLTA